MRLIKKIGPIRKLKKRETENDFLIWELFLALEINWEKNFKIFLGGEGEA
jgi:hypothetical protein